MRGRASAGATPPPFLRPGAAARRFPVWSVGNSLDHHLEQYPAFIPPARPAHPPAIQVIAKRDRPAKPQEFRFNMHSPLRTCMARPPPEVNATFRSRCRVEEGRGSECNSTSPFPFAESARGISPRMVWIRQSPHRTSATVLRKTCSGLSVYDADYPTSRRSFLIPNFSIPGFSYEPQA